MNFRIEIKRLNDIVVLCPIGEMTFGIGDIALRKTVNELIEGGYRKFIIDFSDSVEVDSSGIGELVITLATLSRVCGMLKLCNLRKAMRHHFEITDLRQIFEIFDDVKDAMRSF